jgi:hypothetical protein
MLGQISIRIFKLMGLYVQFCLQIFLYILTNGYKTDDITDLEKIYIFQSF